MVINKTKKKTKNKINKIKQKNKTNKIKQKNKTNKLKQKNKNKILHFFDDQSGWMEGITFSKDGTKIKNIMCTNNIVCHKVPNPNSNNITKKKYKYLLNKYISNISNKNMKNYIKYENERLVSLNQKNVYTIFSDVQSGLSKKQINFLLNPNLKDIIVAFDMDNTLHQTNRFTNMHNNKFINLLSNLTKSKISINDIGEYYFGGKHRLSKIKDVFLNLNKTIGMQNVYIITANQGTLVSEILPKLYSKLFNVKFLKSNIKIADGNTTKYNIIKEILNI